jgi:hypothetical protein
MTKLDFLKTFVQQEPYTPKTFAFLLVRHMTKTKLSRNLHATRFKISKNLCMVKTKLFQNHFSPKTFSFLRQKAFELEKA